VQRMWRRRHGNGRKAGERVFSGGGGGGGESPPAPQSSIGVFTDSVVSGLSYQTATYSGITNASGEFNYLPGESITFSVGGVILGSCIAGPLVTPLSLVPTATGADDPVVTNIVRLLLTLDDDANPDTGINITSNTSTAAENITINFSNEDFSIDSGVISLLADLPGSPALVDISTAQTHFSATLNAQVGWGSMSWGSGTWINGAR